MPVTVIDTLKPKNNGSFPIVEAVDVAVSAGQRLPEALAAKADASALAATDAAVATKADKTDISLVNEKIEDLKAQGLQQTPLFAENVEWLEENGDTSKVYVLPDGFLYAHTTKEIVIEAGNKLDLSAVSLNARLSGSSGSVTANGSPGYFVTDFIAISDLANISPYNVRLNWELTAADDNKVVYYDSNKTRIGSAVISGLHIPITITDGETVFDLRQSPTEQSWADVAHVRFQFCINRSTDITSEDIINCKIFFDAENKVETLTGWHNTGHAFVPADYEDRINELEEDIRETEERLTILESTSPENDSVIIPAFWKNAVDECIVKIKSLQNGINCVTFPFFSDNHQRNGYAGILISYIMKECHIPYCFYGGDSISNGYIASEEAMISEDKAFDDIMKPVPNGRLCRAVGNHDGYWAVSSTEKYYYTREQIYDLFLREEAVSQLKHFGGDGTYYYVDDIASRMRFIVLNTNGGIDSTQLEWLQNTAMQFTEDGWGIVFISHQPISNHYHANISNAETVRAAVSNYINGTSANKAEVVGWFSGHIHRDRIYTGVAINTTDDTEGDAMGFTQVTITSDHTSIAYDDATKHTVANDNQSHAIDFVTINKTTRTVNLTRLGIGNDRSYTY